MAKNRKKQKKQTWADVFYGSLNYLLNVVISIYMLLILVILPFYNEEGYSHIGTDKSTFFRRVFPICGVVAIAIAVAMLLVKIYMYVAECKAGHKTFFFKQSASETVSGLKGFFRKNMTITDWFAFGYGICVILSYVFTNYKDEALWGTRGWFMGMLPQMAVILTYFFISRMWEQRNWIVYSIIPVSGIVFALGYLNRFGIHPIDMQIKNNSFVSTIGNINWYCGYMMSVLFIGFVLLWKEHWKQSWQKTVLLVYVAIGFATLVTQGSLSGMAATAVVLLVAFLLSAGNGRRMEMFGLELVILSGVCLFTALLCTLGVWKSTYPYELDMLYKNVVVAGIMTVVSVGYYLLIKNSNKKKCYPQKVFTTVAKVIGIGAVSVVVLFLLLLVVNTATDGIIYKLTGMSKNNILTFSADWGSGRGATFLAGFLCFSEQDLIHKLFGVGPDCMAKFLYTDGSKELLGVVRETFANQRLTNAHNEWLTILVNIGLPGCICYAGMMITSIVRFIKNHEKSVIATACGFCVLAYTVNNMVSFQQTMSLATVFVVFGIGENYLRKAKSEVQ